MKNASSSEASQKIQKFQALFRSVAQQQATAAAGVESRGGGFVTLKDLEERW